jgi:tRNA(fMet)-specific endonuclease VapC
LRGKLNLDEIIREKGKENCSISEITIAELRFGAENSQNPIKSNIAVDNFIRGISIIPIISSLRLYAKEKVRLRKLGKPINDEFDLLIGVTAVQNKMKLVTDNVKDFENIMDIQIENWFKR